MGEEIFAHTGRESTRPIRSDRKRQFLFTKDAREAGISQRFIKPGHSLVQGNIMQINRHGNILTSDGQ